MDEYKVKLVETVRRRWPNTPVWIDDRPCTLESEQGHCSDAAMHGRECKGGVYRVLVTIIDRSRDDIILAHAPSCHEALKQIESN